MSEGWLLFLLPEQCAFPVDLCGSTKSTIENHYGDQIWDFQNP